MLHIFSGTKRVLHSGVDTTRRTICQKDTSGGYLLPLAWLITFSTQNVPRQLFVLGSKGPLFWHPGPVWQTRKIIKCLNEKATTVNDTEHNLYFSE